MEKRKLKIALSLAVLIPCVLYIAGIIAQFMININAWKAAGSDYSVSPGLPSLELADVFRSIFHFPEGLIAIGVVVVGIVLICIFGLRIGWGQNGVTDSDRNLTVSSSGSYGTASFMSPKEASACFDVTSARRPSRTSLACYLMVKSSHSPKTHASIPTSPYVARRAQANPDPYPEIWSSKR